MNEKKRKLIETGVALFTEKGYHATSIQEIASRAGISKGAFYLYFQSKEDFITTAVDFFQEQIESKFEKVRQVNEDERNSFIEQINVLTEFIYNYKGFISMHLREDISISEKTDQLIHQMRADQFHWIRTNLEAIYGEKIKPILMDCVIQFDGLLTGYYKWIIIDDVKMDRSKIGAYIMKRMDSLVDGIINNKEAPLATIDHIPEKLEQAQDVINVVKQLREKITSLPIEQTQLEGLYEVVDEILAEVQKDNPRKLILQGLFVHIQRFPVLHDECEKIATYLNIELLH